MFEKGYTPIWGAEIFSTKKIKTSNPPAFILEDYQGNEIKGGFYEQEISKTKQPDVCLIEKIIKKDRKKGLCVKFLGFDKSQSSSIPNKNIVK